MGRRRKNKAKELSADVVLFHILPRLPANSLRRFRFACKQWHSFITSPVFAQMHLHHQNQNQNHHKLLLLSDTFFRTIDFENPNKGKSSFTFSNVPLPFSVDDYDFSVVNSFHGMVCLRRIKKGSDDNYNTDLILWNPVTGDYKTLSKAGCCSHKEFYYNIDGGLFRLYYSSFDDDYKLIYITWQMRHPNVYIYSMKSDSWRKVDSSLFFDSWRLSSTAFLNEKLYFLVGREYYANGPVSYSIIRFDTKREKFIEIATPFPGNAYWLCFSELRGCIHLCAEMISSRSVELWRMDDGEYWRMVVSSSFRCYNQEPLHLMTNENWLSKDTYNLYQVDVKEHTQKRLCALPFQTTIVEYMETIVSPNRYTK